MPKEVFLYPVLGGSRDLGFARVSGHGLGNCFYAYFQTFALARKLNGRIIYPAWRSIKPARILRGHFGERSYWGTFQPHPDEITGLAKAALLSSRAIDLNAPAEVADLAPGSIYRVYNHPFTFSGLHEYRKQIRQRLLDIATENPKIPFEWGGGDYIAIHVRLGDFDATSVEDLLAGKANARIPLGWYVEVIQALRSRHPELPIKILSDGNEQELAPLLSEHSSLLRTGSDMGDLYALAGAKILVGSNSTYSRWAAFLGNMRTIWIRTSTPLERTTSEDIPTTYVELGRPATVGW